MSASATASSLLVGVTPRAQFLCNPSLSLFYGVKPLGASNLSARFVRRVAFTSDVDQDDFLSDGDENENENENERSFSPDLKIFVGNLPFSVDSAQLADLFESVGTVDTAEVVFDKESGRSRGFGFVTMSSAQEVEAAVQQFNGYEIDGREIRVNSGPPPPKRETSFGREPRGSGGYNSFDRGSRGGEDSYNRGGSRGREDSYNRGGSRSGEDSYNRGGSRGGEDSFNRGGPRGGGGRSDSPHKLYVSNLSWGVDDAALESLFSEQGDVLEAKVIYDRETGRSRGFGFVTYSSASEVSSAIQSLDGSDMDGREIRVSQAESKPRRSF